jgi:hypothetical protein
MAAVAPREDEAGEGEDPEAGEGATSADFETLVGRAEAAIEHDEEEGPSNS